MSDELIICVHCDEVGDCCICPEPDEPDEPDDDIDLEPYGMYESFAEWEAF